MSFISLDQAMLILIACLGVYLGIVLAKYYKSKKDLEKLPEKEAENHVSPPNL